MIGRFFKGLIKSREEPDDTSFIYVLLPAPLEPDEREARFGAPIDAELQLTSLGYVSGGGQLLSAPDEKGDRTIQYCGIDVDAVDVDATRELLRFHLPMLGCPAGTEIQYRESELDLMDRYDGDQWALARPRPRFEA